MGDTEQACLGILTGLKKEGLITPASPAQPEAPPQSPSRRVSFSEAPATTPRRGARHDDGVKQMEEALDADAAKVAGVWQSDGSQHTSKRQVKAGDPYVPNVRVSPREGRRTLKVLYLFSGVERRASIADHLKRLCCADGTGLDFYDVDIHVGGSSHDLLDGDVQEDYIARILAGEFDFVILSPPCGSWSRANWANNDGPPPCRDRFQPWGFAENTKAQRGRADRGNQFVHFSIRAIQTAQLAKAKGFQVRCLLEHPEDLGRVGRQALHQGVPASIWQLDELRQAFGSNAATTVAGWQCQFPDVDYAKPTRLYSDVPGIEAFGRKGWPILDRNHHSNGPLPRYCGHNHSTKTIGKDKDGGYNISPTAAYPEAMCEWIAGLIYKDWLSAPPRPLTGGSSSGSHRSQKRPAGATTTTTTPSTPEWTPWTTATPGSNPWPDTNTLVPAGEVERATAEANALGVDHCFKDGIARALPEPSSEEDNVRSWSKVGDSGDATTDVETELNDFPRPQRGEGHWGSGPAMRIARKGLYRDFSDGAGLCSPGRWPKDRRCLPSTEIAAELQDILLRGLAAAEKEMPQGNCKAVFHTIIAGKLLSSPFSAELIENVRADLRIALKAGGYGDGLPQAGDRVQAFEVRLIQSLLFAFGDPDHYFGEFWARGVWLGSRERKLPRTPAVFDRKVKWKYSEPDSPSHGEWQTNYPSLREHAATVNEQFREEEREGLMIQMSLREAIRRFGKDLIITATGAIEKKGKRGEVRVIFDATNGVLVNLFIRVRDQVKCPAAGDAKAVLRELHREGGSHTCLVYDISKAHRRVPVDESEWGRQACQVEVPPPRPPRHDDA